MKKMIIVSAAVLLLMGTVLLGGCVPGSSEDTAPTGETTQPETSKAPDFTVFDAQGKEYSLSDFVGQPVVLNFWASWCGPCKNEMPDFEQAYLDYGDEIQFMMVNLTDGSQETVASASQFIAQAGYTFPVFYDTNSDAAVTYSIYSIPVTYFIDAEGNLVAYGQGTLSAENLQAGINMITK